MSWTHSANPRWQRGAAAVEMAIIMPLLLLFVAGIVDFGRYFLVQIQLTNAAREGARVAVIGESEANIIARATAATPVAIGLTVTATECSGSGTDAEVTVGDTGFKWILLGPAMSFFGSTPTSLPDATATAVMRCEA